jgi:hypothetical protein
MNNFDETIERGWLKCEEIFLVKTLKPVFRYHFPSIRRAKRIQMPPNRTVIVTIKADQNEARKLDILLRVCPDEKYPCLPEGLNFSILSESGEIRTEIRVISRTENIEHRLLNFKKGEGFGFRLESEGKSVTEYFIV